MAFNYFQNQSYIGRAALNNSEGVGSLDSTRQNEVPIGGAMFSGASIGNNGNRVHSWTVPAKVTSVSIVCIGGGGGGMYWGGSNINATYAMSGGGGGALAWLNEFPVVPNSTITIQTAGGGADGAYSGGSTGGGDSWFYSTSTIIARGGNPGRYNTNVSGGTFTVSSSYGTYGGGNGGQAYRTSSSGYGPAGGGGAGGYSGAGGQGRDDYYSSGQNGNGGGGAGGGAASGTYTDHISGGGGGVHPYGEGSSGLANTDGSAGGGSGGTDSPTPSSVNGTQKGGSFGAGGGGKSSAYWGAHAGEGNTGVVRVIWGPNRAFPATNAGQNYLGISETVYL